MTWIAVFAITLLVLWLIATFKLKGPDLSEYDYPVGQVFESHPADKAASDRFIPELAQARADVLASRSWRKGLALARKFADELSLDLQTQTTFTPVIASGIDGEWAVAPGADTRRRLLFLHGGAFLMGSPRGHRKFSDALSKLGNCAVLSVDYRMLPEHGRHAGILDTQNAYQWILKNGPDGPQALTLLLVAGDSAGGNLALMIAAWSKTQRVQPDGVIGFSPSLDMTMESPTLKVNRATDRILGEGLGLLIRISRSVRAWISVFSMRINPVNPLCSPLFGDLSKLPRTLIQASGSEMLLGESIRYTNKARAAGSDVTLQIWKDQLHDWQLFNMGYGSADLAMSEVKKFIDSLDHEDTQKDN